MSSILTIAYTGLTGDIQIGDDVTASTSGFLGHVIGIDATTVSTGNVHLHLHDGVTDAVVNGETLTFVGATPTGTATVGGTGTPYYLNRNVIVGGNNALYHQHVDERGAAFTRFTDGAPTLNSFGSLLTGEIRTVGVYEFSADDQADLFTSVYRTGGSGSYMAEYSTYAISTTNSSGSYASRTTNKYHFYWPGRGLGLVATMACGDTGVTGNIRRWGLFDAETGVFFALSGSVPCVGFRNTVNGVVTDTLYSQSEWILDKLDGTGVSLQTLNINKITPYVIDYQWLGAGRIRFGIVDKTGQKVWCHVVENSGQRDFPYMSKGSAPFRVESENYTANGGTPTLRITCAAVQHEGPLDYTFWRWSYSHGAKTITGSQHPLISVRAKTQYYGKHNQTNVYPDSYTCAVSGGKVKLELCWPITLAGDTWALDNGTTLEADTAASGSVQDADSWIFRTYYLNDGCHEIKLADLFEWNDEGIIPYSDGSGANPFCLVASLVSGSSASIEGAFNYKELR
jgi:hypothetical protein